MLLLAASASIGLRRYKVIVMDCGKCATSIVMSDLPVTCSGKCGRVFHYKCTPLTKSAAKLITENVNLLFKCDDCPSSQCGDQQNVYAHINRIDEEVKKISSLLESVIGMRDHIAAQTEINVNGALKSFEKLICEKLEIMTSSFFEKFADKKLAVMNEMQSESKSIRSESDRNPKRKKRKFQNSDDLTDDVFQENSSFADVVKNSRLVSTSKNNSNSNTTKNKTRKARPVIVIKPKESKQACEDTRKFLKTQLDPKIHKISNFRNGKDGSIIVDCATGSNPVDVKNGVESNLGENYSAVVPTSVPRLKIVGMSDQFSSDVFIDLLKSQNEDIEINEVNVVNMYQNPRFTYNKFSVVIEVDVDTYNCLLCAKQVNVGFDLCSVIPAINVLRCFKCGEFGHKSMDCSNCETCSRCSQHHKTSDCTSTVLKCVNCLKMNKERNLNLDVNHAAFSSECLVYKRLYDQKKSSLRFNK